MRIALVSMYLTTSLETKMETQWEREVFNCSVLIIGPGNLAKLWVDLVFSGQSLLEDGQRDLKALNYLHLGALTGLKMDGKSDQTNR